MQTSTAPGNPYFTNKFFAVIFAVICAALLLIARFALFYQDWGDLSYFIMPWIETYRSMTFFEGLGTVVGNYNPPYMYIFNFIAQISSSDLSDLYLVKIVSVFFDFLIAYFVMKIVSLKTDSINLRLLAFILALAIPTVILNSSMWGQCDSIYAAFAIGSLYFGLKGRSKLTYVFAALAFSFKMQAVFMMPMLLVFLLMKKIRFTDCYLFFVVYFATLLPAVIVGMPIGDVLSTYFNQAGTYDWLYRNIANVWQFTKNVPYDNFVIIGICIAALAVLGLLYFTWVNRERLVSNTDYIRLAYLFVVILPFLLPKMHDRYYFLADVLSVLVFLFDKKRWYIPVICIFCSFIAYAWFLMGAFEVIDFKIATAAMFIVIMIVLRDYVMSLRSEKNN